MKAKLAVALLITPVALAAQHGQERAALLHACQLLDQSSDKSLQNIRDRTDCWKRMQLQGMGDSTVDASYRAAVADYDAAVKSDSLRHAGDAVDSTLVSAQRAIQARDLATARRLVDGVIASQPDNQRALAFRDRIMALERTQRLRNTLFGMAAAVLLLGLVVAGSARVLARRHDRQVAKARAERSSQKAMLEIIDGIGRGKIYEISTPIYRIGSAESERPEERNDLILSDAKGFISRFHCTIVRKNGKYFLIDSSLNGTYMDEDLLDRGEHRPLEDGDEFSIAGMARVKFLII
jgi:hypothetical protein